MGLILLITNLYLGEISLRTKGDHQLAGYAEKYLGRKGGWLMEFAHSFGIYAAIVAYLVGVGGSISFLIYGDFSKMILFGVLFGFIMSGFLWRGLKGLKRFEKIGVTIVLILLVAIFFVFIGDVNYDNLKTSNLSKVFLPFGVVLFALLSFSAVPEIEVVLHKREHLMKKVLFTSTIISVLFYILFAFIVVGFKGIETPEIATLALGNLFVFLGIFTMFTSYLALGNALEQNLICDEKMSKFNAWFISAIVPIGVFLLTQLTDFFSFTKILSIGGVVSGGLTAVLILLMVKNAKKKSERKPEYSFFVNNWIIWFLIFIFVLGIVVELGGI